MVIASSKGTMLYGGDYNPEQWPRSIWQEDMRLFKQAHINELTLNVFSWARLQPSEDEYDFHELDEIVDLAVSNELSIVMATSTAALPAWMSLRHPDVNRVEFDGRVMRHNSRHNMCINSPTYRKYSVELASKLAERYSGLDNLVAWHVNNEYGGFCWCDNCASAFRVWLLKRYGSIEVLNDAWNTAFWSHTYHSFEEIFPPNRLGDFTPWGNNSAVLPPYTLDYMRFYGECVLESFNEEKAAIRRFDDNRPVTTNMMGTFPDYDYFTWRSGASDDGRGGVDVASWDSYPASDTSSAEICMRHDLMRAVGGQHPWMLMEQTPSRQNWMPYCYQKRPGQMRQMSWQAIAHGADTVQFFQLRQNRSGCEKFHGAVIGSDGTDKTRVFRECAELGAELEAVSPLILGSSVEHGRVAVVFDWQSRWGLGLSAGPTVDLDYTKQILGWYEQLHRRNVPVDIVSKYDDLCGYDVVFAPVLYMLDDRSVANMRNFVEQGGRLVLTAMSALVDEHDSIYQGEIPVPLRDLAGIWSEETDSLPPEHPVPVRFSNGNTVMAHTLFDVVHPDADTHVLASYGDEYYAGTPAVTFHPVADGGICYVASMLDSAGIGQIIDVLLEDVAMPSDIEVSAGSGLEITRRVTTAGDTLIFLINPAENRCVARAAVSCADVLSGRLYAAGDVIPLDAYGVVVLKIADAS